MKEIQTIIGNTKASIALVGLMLITLVCSCSSNDDFDERHSLKTAGVAIGGVNGFSTDFEEDNLQTRSGNGLTRAWDSPSGYVPYEGGVQPIAIAFAEKNMDPDKLVGSFFMAEGKWRAMVDFESNHDYYLYGFIPDTTVIKYSITDIHPDDDDDSNGSTDAKHDGYNLGAIMTMRDVPTVMPHDLCVVIGAKHGTDKEHDSGLRKGDFSFKTSQGSDGKDYVFLLFDHLYAAMRIRMKVYADYAALRTIKLKSLKLATLAGASASSDKTDIIVNLEATDGSDAKESPIKSISYDPTAGEPVDVAEGGMEFWSSASGHELTTDFQPFIGHFMPNGITQLILTSTYDVYDTEGNLIRENSKATNTMVLKDLLTEQETTQRGKRYTINMTIQPTFLYMLSEPDLDNPTVVLEP